MIDATEGTPLVAVNGNCRMRWFVLNACVTEPSLTSDTEPMLAASGVWTPMLAPYVAVDGAELRPVGVCARVAPASSKARHTMMDGMKVGLTLRLYIVRAKVRLSGP